MKHRKLLTLFSVTALTLTPLWAQDELDQILEEVNREVEATIPRAGSVEELSRKAEPVTKGSAILEEPAPESKFKSTPADKKPSAGETITLPDETGKVTRMEKADSLPAGIEETRIYTMRNIKLRKSGNSDWEDVRIPVPVYYRTRSIAWGQEQLREAFALQQRIAGYLEKLKLLKKEGNMLLEEYNKLVLSGIPEEVLGNDSPSIPEALRNASLAQPLRGRDIQISVQSQP
jgi:hypothetical protein